MDPSALIFVALAAAWAAYLVPKALRHHDAAQSSRSVERFSRSMRVLARREVVDRRNARLVVQPSRPSSAPVVETKARAASAASDAPARPEASPAARRAAAKRATQRRQRVLALVLTLNAGVVGPAIGGVISWWWVSAPVTLLVAWLVACRLMVRTERAARPARRTAPVATAAPEAGADDETGAIRVIDADLPAAEPPAPEVVVASPLTEAPAASTGEISVISEPLTPGLWDPVPTTLPTYVSKPAAARRTVQTIDLDSTGVWSSGRNEIDSALAREAEQIAKVEKAAAESSERRASGA